MKRKRNRHRVQAVDSSKEKTHIPVATTSNGHSLQLNRERNSPGAGGRPHTPPGTSLSLWPNLSTPKRSWDSTCHTLGLSSPSAQVTESCFPSQMSRMSNSNPLPFLKHLCLQSPVGNASSCPKHMCSPLLGTQKVLNQCGFPFLLGPTQKSPF